MRFLRRSFTGLFLLALTCALLAAAGFQVFSAFEERLAAEGRPPQGRERQFAVNVVTVTPSRVTPILTAYGQIEARQTLDLRAPAAGRIVDISDSFEEGGAVEAGEVILRIDTADAEAAVHVARADLLEAEADARDAERARDIAADDLAAAQAQRDLRKAGLDRQQGLFDRGVGSSAALEEAALSHAAAAQSVLSKRQALADAETAVDRAKTAIFRARTDLDDTQRTLEDMTITAAFDGVLSEVTGALGTLLSGNEQVATLIAPGELEVAFRISTEQYARLVEEAGRLPNMPVTVHLAAAGLDLTVAGQVVRESAAVAEGQTGRMLYARLDPAPAFRPGDFVTVSIEEPPLDGVARLPAAALAANGTVLAVTEQSRLEEIPVRLLRRLGDEILVAAQDMDGRQVVAERSPLLGAGIRVRVNGTDPEAAGEMIALDDAQRASLLQFVETSPMPPERRARLVEQLSAKTVSADLVARLEQQMGS